MDADLAICRLAHEQGSVFVETDDAEADADGRQDIFGIVKQGQDKSIREAEANGWLIGAGAGVGVWRLPVPTLGFVSLGLAVRAHAASS